MSQNHTPFDDFLNADYASIGDYIFSLSGTEYAIIGALLGLVIGSKLTINQQNSVGNFLELVGQTLLAISAQEYNRKSQNNPQNINQDILNKINKLEEELNKIKRANK